MQARSKKYSLVSGNWPRKNAFLSYLHTYSNVYQNIYLLFLKKVIANTQIQTKKQKNYRKHTNRNKKAKETNEEKRHTKETNKEKGHKKETKEEKEKENAVAVNSV